MYVAFSLNRSIFMFLCNYASLILHNSEINTTPLVGWLPGECNVDMTMNDLLCACFYLVASVVNIAS